MKLFRISFLLLMVLGWGLGRARLEPRILKRATRENQPILRSRSSDTLFFDDFESGSVGWTFQDLTDQDLYWHIDTVNPYEGHSFWCGRYALATWANPTYGYGDEWVQFLISPTIDLTAVSGDTVLLSFPHFYSLEAPTGPFPLPHWDGWDCITVWISTNNGISWEVLRPDTARWPGTEYNIEASWAWFFNGLSGLFDSIPGWGDSNHDWSAVGFDLTPYKGALIKLRFTAVSDPLESDQTGGPYYGMWYLDNITVQDNLGNSYFYEDCEAGMGQWLATSCPTGNYWHTVTHQSNSPVTSWWCGDSLTGEYPPLLKNLLISPEIDLSRIAPDSACLLDFYVNFDFPEGGNTDTANQIEGYLVEVSSDNGETWTNIYFPSTGTSYYLIGTTDNQWFSHNEVWTQSGLPPMELNYWAGEVVRVRIGVFSDYDNDLGAGLFVDDFSVIGKYKADFPKQEQVLVIDDDLGAKDLAGYPWEKYYEYSIASNGYTFATINEEEHGLPDSLYMRKNGMVIWNLGPKGKRYSTQDPLSLRAIKHINGYLRMGGKLLLVGQDYLYDNLPNSFADSVLAIVGNNEDIGADSIVGIIGDPISNGLTYPVAFNHLNGNNYGYDYIDGLLTTATPVFYTNRTYRPIMIRRSDQGYRLIFSTFPIEAVVAAQMRDTLLSRIINWLDPTPPAPYLTKLQSLSSGVKLFWLANPPKDLYGYNIYRAKGLGGPFMIIGTVAPSETTYLDNTVIADSSYYYGVKAYDISMQESGISNLLQITFTGIEEDGLSSTADALQLQVYPTVFREKTCIKFQIPNSKSQIPIKIYDATGRLVKSFNHLTNYQSPIIWSGKDDLGRKLPSGVYFVQLEPGDDRRVEKLVLLR